MNNNLKKVFEAHKDSSRIELMTSIHRGLSQLNKFREFLLDNKIDNNEIWDELNKIEKELKK